MTIEFNPPALKGLLEGMYGERRVKNRVGFLISESEGEPIAEPQAGFVWDLYNIARDLDIQNPSGTYTIYEHGCYAEGIPASFIPSHYPEHSRRVDTKAKGE